MKNYLYSFTLFFLPFASYGTRPTQHATNLVISATECNSLTLSWTPGNGNARLVVARADAPVNWAPTDCVVYAAYLFGTGATYGPNNDNYIISNSQSLNLIKLTNLPPGHKYYFTIFEHDNTSCPEYYTTGAPTASELPYYLDLKYNILYHDSCEIKNRYTFVNKSNSNIPGVTYMFHFGDNDTSSLDSVTHSYSHISGIVPSYISADMGIAGCKNKESKGVRVYQKKVVMMDWSFNHDTVQCWYKNFFSLRTMPLTNPLSVSYGYRWFTKTDTPVFSFFKKSFKESGRQKISLEITTNISKGANQYPTACKDTISFYINVLPEYAVNADVDKDTQEIHSNLFKFSVKDTTQGFGIWSFGDGDTSQRLNAIHTYKDTGNYIVSLVTYGSQPCPGDRTFHVYVYDSTAIADTTLSVGNVGHDALKVYPNPSGGMFTIESDGIERITVYDLSGRKLEGIKANSEKMMAVDLRHLSKGLYLLKLEGNNHSSTMLVRIL